MTGLMANRNQERRDQGCREESWDKLSIRQLPINKSTSDNQLTKKTKLAWAVWGVWAHDWLDSWLFRLLMMRCGEAASLGRLT
jgi:hypothetical protein